MPIPSDPAADEPIDSDTELFASSPAPAGTADEPIRHDTERFDSLPVPAGAADEPIRRETERFDSPPSTTDAVDAPIRNDVERFGSLAPPGDAADEPLRHDAERFPVARAGGRLGRPSGIGEFRLRAPVEEPDLPDGVAPYAEVLCDRQQSAIELLVGGERPGAVAETLGIGRTTLWRWRKYDWQFRRALAAARQAVFGEAARAASAASSRKPWTTYRPAWKTAATWPPPGSSASLRVDRYEPETEDYPVPDHTPWPEALPRS